MTIENDWVLRLQHRANLQERVMSYYTPNDPRASFGMAAEARIEAGLRQHMLRVYGYMAGGLTLTGLIAYAAAVSGFYQAIPGTPLLWIVMLAPLGFVLVLSFGIDRISAGTAILLFWICAAVMGLSLGGIFLVFTGTSIARVFFITAATYGAMSLYGFTTARPLKSVRTPSDLEDQLPRIRRRRLPRWMSLPPGQPLLRMPVRPPGSRRFDAER
jgi:Inhibitor of apoptosis-promoting Bax1